jgi:hypothetical protein
LRLQQILAKSCAEKLQKTKIFSKRGEKEEAVSDSSASGGSNSSIKKKKGGLSGPMLMISLRLQIWFKQLQRSKKIFELMHGFIASHIYSVRNDQEDLTLSRFIGNFSGNTWHLLLIC